MAEGRAKRKLSAILSADVKGYSRLMGEDELATVRTLEAYREMIVEVIRNYLGRVVDSPGDNLLAEFSSVVDAVECAVEIQMELRAKNEELSEDRKMEFRIGINLGDVIEENERIYGDGINVAARIEGLAAPGGICISGTAFDQVESKLGLEFEYLGEQAVKNIKKPVRVYKVKMGSGVSDPELSQEVPLHDKPSIAVLPFVNMSGDPEQEYFSDGITEEIITGLSKIPRMHVIARNSTFTYKGKPVKAQQVGKELGVRYVLEGSVRKAGNRIRVTAQLVDAVTGYHLWAERYERELRDIFALQDEITMKILTALQVELTDGEQVLLRHETTGNLEAWGYAVKASGALEKGTKEACAKARGLLEQAVALDPEYVSALVGLALAHWFDARFGWSDSPPESIRQTSMIAQKVLSLDDTNPGAHALMGCIHLYLGEYEQAIKEAEKSVALGPSHAFVHALAAHIFRFSGKFDQAIAMIKKAMRLQPYLSGWYLMELGMSYYCLGRYEEASDVAEQLRLLAQSRGEEIIWGAYLMLAMNYVRLGREQEARLAAAELLRLNPDYSLELDRRYSCYKDPHILERQHEDLRKAGLK
ncbi:MAG: adenylate/guanylate cyclase domain-containing protein [Desulfobacteraceae bacterium]